jgi:acyl-CoA dehydrogenase
MPFDFAVAGEVEASRARIATFIDAVVVPREQEAFVRGVDDGLRADLQASAKSAGLWAPTASSAMGGGGFRFDDLAILLEEAGRSLLGPLALNCAAPDEGNIHLLEKLCTQEQCERYLRPLVDGSVRSCFAMTEPPPGAGSDPSALRTSVRQVSGGWSLSGEKHLITGADGAAFCIVLAAGPTEGGATMLLVEAGSAGMSIGGHTRTIDATSVGGHSRVLFDDVFVEHGSVLGEPDAGLRYAQVRLAPARLTHCMRWLGAARRAHEIATARARERVLFGSRLGDHGMAQQMLADNEIDLAAARALLWQSCWRLAEGEAGTGSSSIAKVFISEAVSRVADRAVQLCGGLGTSEELVVGRIYADIRAFRIYDGASEVHRMSIARKLVGRPSINPDGSSGGVAS